MANTQKYAKTAKNEDVRSYFLIYFVPKQLYIYFMK